MLLFDLLHNLNYMIWIFLIFFAKKSDLSHQFNNGEVDSKHNHGLANPKQNKNKPRPIMIKFVRHNFRRRIFFKRKET